MYALYAKCGVAETGAVLFWLDNASQHRRRWRADAVMEQRVTSRMSSRIRQCMPCRGMRATAALPASERRWMHVQATLAMDAPQGQRVGISAKVNDEPEVLLCSLREGSQESANLDIVLDHYTEFAVHGGAAVHLAGYYMPAYEQEEGAHSTRTSFWSHSKLFGNLRDSQELGWSKITIGVLNPLGRTDFAWLFKCLYMSKRGGGSALVHALIVLFVV